MSGRVTTAEIDIVVSTAPRGGTKPQETTQAVQNTSQNHQARTEIRINIM